MSEVELYKRIKDATVALASMIPDGKTPFTIFGSGFCIDKEGIIVTCEHVLSSFMEKSVHEQIDDLPQENEVENIGPVNMIKPFVLFYKMLSPKELSVMPCHVERACALIDNDLGVLKVNLHPAFSDGYPTVEIEDYKNISDGDDIGTCGFPLGNYLYKQLGTITSSFTKGIISSIIPTSGGPRDLIKGFQLNITATHGNSGGPVFSMSTGKVFGVLQRSVENQQGHFVQGFIKAESVYAIFKNNLIQRMKAAEPNQFPRID